METTSRLGLPSRAVYLSLNRSLTILTDHEAMNITSPALSILQSLTSNNTTSNLFSIIYGQGTTATADPVSSLISAEKDQTKDIALQAKDPETKSAISHFLSAVAKAPDLKTLLADPIARDVLLTANGLGDQSSYTALATKALLSDTSKTNNLASTLSDPRWLDMAKTYDFANQGLTKLKTPDLLNTITSGYAEVKWRESLDASTPGLSAALDFRSRASTITSVDQILGDKNLRNVVTTALGIPLQIAFQSVEAQEKAISSKVDISQFKDAKFVEQFARRFLIANQASATTSNYA